MPVERHNFSQTLISARKESLHISPPSEDARELRDVIAREGERQKYIRRRDGGWMDGCLSLSLSLSFGNDAETAGDESGMMLRAILHPPGRGLTPRGNEDKARSANHAGCRMICIQKKPRNERRERGGGGDPGARRPRRDRRSGKGRRMRVKRARRGGEGRSPGERVGCAFNRGQSRHSVKTVPAIARALKREKSGFWRGVRVIFAIVTRERERERERERDANSGARMLLYRKVLRAAACLENASDTEETGRSMRSPF